MPSLVSLLALCVASIACRSPASTSTSDDPASTASATNAASAKSSGVEASNVITITTNTQAAVGEVRIAAYNFADDSWVDPSGAVQRGRTCALQVHVRGGDASSNQKLRVHEGQTFSAGGRSFRVVTVGADRVTLLAS